MDTHPVRIQRRRIAGWRMPTNTRYVGRGSRYRNPFQIQPLDTNLWTIVDLDDRSSSLREEPPHIAGKDMAHTMATRLFGLHIGPMGLYRHEFSDLTALAGYNLACWCPKHLDCHADVLLDRVNDEQTLNYQ